MRGFDRHCIDNRKMTTIRDTAWCLFFFKKNTVGKDDWIHVRCRLHQMFDRCSRVGNGCHGLARPARCKLIGDKKHHREGVGEILGKGSYVCDSSGSRRSSGLASGGCARRKHTIITSHLIACGQDAKCIRDAAAACSLSELASKGKPPTSVTGNEDLLQQRAVIRRVECGPECGSS